MRDHLTEEEIRNYIKSRMSPGAIQKVDLHLIECAICRAAVNVIDPLDVKAPLLVRYLLVDELEIGENEFEHLGYDQIAAYVDKKLTESERNKINTHIEICSVCDEEVQSLLSFKEEVLKDSTQATQLVQVPTFKQKRFATFYKPTQWSQLQIAATVIIVFAIGLTSLLLLRRDAAEPTQTLRQNNTNGGNENSITHIAKDQTDTGANKPSNQEEHTTKDNNFNNQPRIKKNEPEPSAKIALTLKDGSQQVNVDALGNLEGIESLPAPWQRAMRDAIVSNRLLKPDVLDQLKAEAGTLLGTSTDGLPFVLINPSGSIIENNRPTFHWKPLDGATGYTVNIFDSNLNEVATSGQINALEWSVSEPLTRGKIYSWQVTAIKDGLEVISPSRPARPPKFKVLEQEKLTVLERARQDYPDSHLLLGVLYAQAGLIDEAERELQALVKDNPHSDVAVRLLNKLRSWKVR